MRDITEDEIRSEFGEKTFLRGLEYFESNQVRMGVIKGTTIAGTVRGSMQYPYMVEIDIEDGITCRCTCPVGARCKHGVALLLQWINSRGSFVDADRLLASLRKKSKEELISIIDSILEDDLTIASKLAFSEIVEEKIDIEAVSKRLHHIDKGFLDYHAVSGVAEELEDIKVVGDNCVEEGRFDDAVEVYLSLIEWGVDTLKWGADDSDGELGDVLYCCVEDFIKAARKLGEKQKRGLIYRVLDIIDSENYGLGTDTMLYGLATENNISFIETELLKRIPGEESFHVEYSGREILKLLSDLYRELGMFQDALRVIEEAGLKNAGDYVLMAKVLMDQNKHEKAFDFVREHMFSEGEEDEIDMRLNDLYFVLLHKFLSEGNRIEVNAKEVVALALYALSHSVYVNSEIYKIIRDVLKEIGEYKNFISFVKEKCEESVAIEVLLYEDYVEEAISIALSSTAVYPSLLIEVAEAARKKGKIKAAIKLTLGAVKEGFTVEEGFTWVDAPVDELVKLVVAESDDSVLKEAVDHIHNVGIARLFVDSLLGRNQEYVIILLKRFIRDIKKEELLKYATGLEIGYQKEIFCFWVSEFINRSHLYYDDAVDILKVLKGIASEEEWELYISTFKEKNKGKKKLMEKIEAALL